MSAQQLIEIAAAKGYRIGKERRGVYYYGKGADLRSYTGSWQEFVKLVRGL